MDIKTVSRGLSAGTGTGRFAPTASGRAHPGTLLAGLLAWLDARTSGSRLILRIEDIDSTRVTDELRTGLIDDLEWFGLDWDLAVFQSDMRANHDALMDILADTRRLYACGCTRSRIKAAALPAADGGWRYPGTCRGRTVTNWRDCAENIRLNTEGLRGGGLDLSGADCTQDVSMMMGDPLLRRADGSFTYMLAVVADDHAQGITRIVRGRDLLTSTATQCVLYQLAGWTAPVYRHHMLLLEPHGAKLAKFHQSVGADVLRQFYSPIQLRGILAYAAGLTDSERGLSMQELLRAFSWERVRASDRVLEWNGQALISRA